MFGLSHFLSNAQDFVDNTPFFGVKGGYNYATLRGSEIENSSFSGIHSLYVGAFMEIPLGTIFSIQPEILFSRQGAKWKKVGLLPDNELYEAKFRMDYINIPILANLKITEKFTFQIAPQFGFLVTPPDIWSETAIFNGKKSIDKEAFSSFYFALAFGGKYAISEQYFLDFRYTTSLTNVFSKNNESLQSANISNQNYFRHSYFSVGVGYIF
ncbi:MAG: porin family protein [Capnocytophaga sp.]|nr:porin family protein [Capnocytophaga sp.]